MTVVNVPVKNRPDCISPPVPRRFDGITIAFHWSTVGLMVLLFGLAWGRQYAHDAAQAGMLLMLHRSCGVTIWLLSVARAVWRLRYAFLPPFPPRMSEAQRWAAKLSEYGLYLLLFIQPLTGMAQSMTRGRPFALFGLQVPKVMSSNHALTEMFENVHSYTALVFLGLIGLHAFAALFHRYVMRDDVLQSMLPWKPTAPAAENTIAGQRGQDKLQSAQ